MARPTKESARKQGFTERLKQGFAGRLERERIQAGYNDAKTFAAHLGLNGPQYRKWARGEGWPEVATLVKISEGTGLSLHWLIFGVGPKRLSTGLDAVEEGQKTDCLPFARKGRTDGPDAMASLALIRALLHHLEQKGFLSTNDVGSIREHASGEFPSEEDSDIIAEARQLIEHKFSPDRK